MSQSKIVTRSTDAVVPVNPEQTLKACKALVAHIKKAAAAPREDGKQNLLADEETTIAETPVWLTLTTKKHIHDSNRMSTRNAPVPIRFWDLGLVASTFARHLPCSYSFPHGGA